MPDQVKRGAPGKHAFFKSISNETKNRKTHARWLVKIGCWNKWVGEKKGSAETVGGSSGAWRLFRSLHEILYGLKD